MENKIPKNIIYVWVGGKSKPQKVLDCIETWKKHMPEEEWNYIEINETNFDINYNNFVKQAYDNKKWAFVADVARLWALYEYGGIYMDTDVMCYKPLDIFLKHKFFTGFEQPNYPVTATMGAEKHNKIIKEFLDYYDDKNFELKSHWLEYETNTKVMSNILGKYIDRTKMEYQDTGEITIYPKETFCRHETMDGVYTEHLMLGSWI